MAINQSARHQKRSRASDGAEKFSRSGVDRAKRRRTSEGNDTQKAEPAESSSIATNVPDGGELLRDMDQRKGPVLWSFSRPVGGRYSNMDPVMTADEAYLFVGLDMAVQVFATSTSRLLRTLQLETGQRVIGFRICPVNQEILYIFTSTFVTKWYWDSGKRLARWGTACPTISVDLPLMQNTGGFAPYFSIVTQQDGKREISINTIGDKKVPGITALQTSKQINVIKVAYGGRLLFASDGSHLFMGTTTNINFENAEAVRLTWREATLPVTATSFDLRESSSVKGADAVDLLVGESGGAIVIYHDIVDTLFGRDTYKKSSPRKLHWHRGPVSTVRWSKDGNYVISGGQESVMVLWQLDTGRKQFLPHLPSPICNIVVSPSGTSHVIKLADNSVIILSARELQPSAHIIGLQLCSDVGSHKDSSSQKPFGAVAVLHPQHPERLLMAVPASHQYSHQGPQSRNHAVLQTFDTRSNSHISRQALARTNTTTLNVGPEGSPIVAPDVQQMAIVQDGKWLATVDTWTPHPQDVEAVAFNDFKNNLTSLRSEVFLKFWKWNASSDMWELVTRIDAPHFTENRHSKVLDIAARPNSHEFATLGADSILRFWCPTTKHRSGLKTNASEPHLDTWKCRGFVDLSGCLDDTTAPLQSACTSFSDDGSVLAVCLPPITGAGDGHVLLVNARKCTVHYRRMGVFFGNPRAAKFLGRYLIVASTGSVVVWDTVDDVVKPIRLSESSNVVDAENPLLLAINSRTKSFAIATHIVEGSTSRKGRRRPRFHIQIYDVPSFDVVFQETLGSSPLALLSDPYSGDYIIVDSTATVQRLGCLDKASQKSSQPYEMSSHLNSGLASIFSRGQEKLPRQPIDGDSVTTQSKGLSSVFGDAPSFSLPSLGVLFRDVVQTLGSG